MVLSGGEIHHLFFLYKISILYRTQTTPALYQFGIIYKIQTIRQTTIPLVYYTPAHTLVYYTKLHPLYK